MSCLEKAKCRCKLGIREIMKAVNAGQDAAGNYYQGTDWAGSMSELTTIQSHPPKKKFRTKEFSSLFFNSIAYDALTAPAPFNAKVLFYCPGSQFRLGPPENLSSVINPSLIPRKY